MTKKELEELENRLKYLLADFDNYKKQFEKERAKVIELANENLIKELLPFIDSLESASLQENGIKLLYKNLLNALEKYGLKEIETKEKKFDANLHEAVLKEKSEKEEGAILEEIQKGYTLKDKVIRYSKVKISG